MKKVFNFLKSAGTYYLATIKGEQSRVRPIGAVCEFKEKLYIRTASGFAYSVPSEPCDY